MASRYTRLLRDLLVVFAAFMAGQAINDDAPFGYTTGKAGTIISQGGIHASNPQSRAE